MTYCPIDKDRDVPYLKRRLRRRRPWRLLLGLPLVAASSGALVPMRAAVAADTLTIRGINGLRVGERPGFAVPASGCSAVTVPGRSAVSILVRGGRISVVAVRTPAVPTASGVAVGQPAARVAEVYGSSVTAQNDGFVYTPGPGPDAGLRMAFEVKDGRVAVIRAGEEGDVLGGCAGGDLMRAARAGSGASGIAATPTTSLTGSATPTTAAGSITTGVAGGAVPARIVVIDPGHNGANSANVRQINALVDAGGFKKACNTVGTTSLSGLTEAAFNWSVARKLGALLTANGWQVVFTRPDNAGWGPCVDQRGLTAGRPGVVALLSIHADGGPSSGHGFHVIWPKPITGLTASTAKASGELAVAVRDALVASGFTPATYIARRGLDNRGDLGTLNRAPVPSVMLEAGNMRNAADDAVLASDAGQQRVAAGVAAGFEAWFATRR